ncbi:MAG: DNA replication/repair protein RecF [Ruminococcaceae bacterium]|nr:DNA replication/repair protein RecF [Oscillospiraceae bacterium]
MIIQGIHLLNFRNYGRLDLDVGPSVNIFYGDNAQGKTNIIEAIYVAGSVTSHRTSKDPEMIRFGENGYSTSLDLLCDDGGKMNLTAEFHTEKSDLTKNVRSYRVLKQDNIKIDRISDYIGVCNIVIFAPEDLNIVKNAPAYRRKFLNTLISKVSPSYFNLISDYSRLMNRKNAYLKSARSGRNETSDIETSLDFWDFSIADLSADIIIMRDRFSRILSEAASRHHSDISGGKESLSVGYDTISGCSVPLDAFADDDRQHDAYLRKGLSGSDYTRIKGILSDTILSKLKSARSYDLEKGISSVGVNKDDLDIKLDGLQMRSFSSQGQQRSASLALKLAELDILRMFTSSTPILLLDDVFSELDADRRASLLSAMKDAQIFITCTDRDMAVKELAPMESSESAKYFKVTSGSVSAG